MVTFSCCNNFIYFVLLLIGLARLFWGNETKSFHEYTLICIRQSSNLLFSDRREHIILCELQSRVNYLKTLFSSYFSLFPARADFLGINLSETVKRLSEQYYEFQKALENIPGNTRPRKIHPFLPLTGLFYWRVFSNRF